MQFYIYVLNHQGSVIQDLALHLQKSLESCGHRAYFSHRLVPGACNILIENFGPQLVHYALELAASGTPFIVWGTEEITGDTFNRKVADSHSHYGDTEHWQLRYDNFLTTAEHATAIWVPVEPLVDTYRAAVPGVPVQFFPHGWAEGFASVTHRAESDKDIDFYFSGARTEHRLKLLDTLASRFSVVHHDHELPEFVRRDYLSRARVCLSLRLSKDTRLPSVSRLHNLVMNRCYTLHEQCPLPCHLDAYVEHAPWAGILRACEEAIARTDRAQRAAAHRDRLRAELPMGEIVPRILDEAFARR